MLESLIFLKKQNMSQSKIRDIKPQLDREICKGNQATSACHDRTATLIPELYKWTTEYLIEGEKKTLILDMLSLKVH